MISKKEKATNKITIYIYNLEDQLIQINFSDGSYAKYGYDGLGRRIYKDVNGSITKFVYDDEDILFEYEGTKLVARYTHGPGIDEPLVMERNNKNYYYLFDGLGSVTQVVDSSGNVVNSYVYDSFGNIKQKAENISNFYTYTAREYDNESGLYYYRARYYDAKVGRFLQRDFIISSSYLYYYVKNNPIRYIDPSGLDSVLEIADWALKEAKKSGLPGWNKGKADAHRHCLWMCVTTVEKGADIAGVAGVVHEIENLIEGYPLEDSIMDLKNNSEGIKKGKSCKVKNSADKRKTCKDECYKAADKGELTTLDPSDPSYFH